MWLQEFIALAVRNRWCTNVGCTTCGAMEFRKGLIEHAAEALGEPALAILPFRKSDLFVEILRALADVVPPYRSTLERPVWRILCEAKCALDADTFESLVEILRALKDAERSRAENRPYERAVRLILCEAKCALDADRFEIAVEKLENTWAGKVLDRMQAHHQERTLAGQRHEEANDPERVRARREAMREERRQMHRLRMERQIELNLVWHERNRDS